MKIDAYLQQLSETLKTEQSEQLPTETFAEYTMRYLRLEAKIGVIYLIRDQIKKHAFEDIVSEKN